MRRSLLVGASLMAASVLVGCASERAQFQMEAAIDDLDPEIFTDADGYASTTGDGPFPDPHVSLFEVTLVEGADLVEAGAQLNMLREDHDVSADVRLGEDKVVWTDDHAHDASVLTDEEWAEVLELAVEEDFTRGQLTDVDDSGETHLLLEYESGDYEEAKEAFLSWQDLEAPAGISDLSGAIDASGPTTDTWLQVPHIQLAAPIGKGEVLPQVVEDAVQQPGWHEVEDLDLRQRSDDAGASLKMTIDPDGEPRGSDRQRELLVEDPEPFRTAEDFADQVEATLGLRGEMDVRITIGAYIELVVRGRFAEEIAPEERNADIVDSRSQE